MTENHVNIIAVSASITNDRAYNCKIPRKTIMLFKLRFFADARDIFSIFFSLHILHTGGQNGHSVYR